MNMKTNKNIFSYLFLKEKKQQFDDKSQRSWNDKEFELSDSGWNMSKTFLEIAQTYP